MSASPLQSPPAAACRSARPPQRPPPSSPRPQPSSARRLHLRRRACSRAPARAPPPPGRARASVRESARDTRYVAKAGVNVHKIARKAYLRRQGLRTFPFRSVARPASVRLAGIAPRQASSGHIDGLPPHPLTLFGLQCFRPREQSGTGLLDISPPRRSLRAPLSLSVSPSPARLLSRALPGRPVARCSPALVPPLPGLLLHCRLRPLVPSPPSPRLSASLFCRRLGFARCHRNLALRGRPTDSATLRGQPGPCFDWVSIA